MRILLDTHIFIWWNENPNLLSSKARKICEDETNILILSLASVWEMQIKSQLGKLTFNQSLPDIIRLQQNNGLELLPVTIQHIYELENLPPHHRDPFDRLLIAQAQVEQMSLLTVDAAFEQYGVKLSG